jgi:pimeloyl-ACP methyl ester carboxylesterase
MQPFRRRNTRVARTTGLVMAAAAAGTAGWVAGRARAAEERYPPSGNFVEVDGVRVHYVERGEGDCVVLLHGNVVMAQDFATSRIFRSLAERYRVVAFDRPGFGYTDRPRVHIWNPDAQAELLIKAFAALGIDRPIVVAHSWATLVGVALGLRNAARKLVLVSGYYFPTALVTAALVAPNALPVVGDALRYTVSALIARLVLHRTIEKMFAPDSVPPNYEKRVPRELMLRPGQLRADAEEGVLLVPAARRYRDRYSALTVPTEIIAGSEDRVCDPETHSASLHRVVSGSALRIVPRAGHMLHHAHADAVIAAVDAARAGDISADRQSVQALASDRRAIT